MKNHTKYSIGYFMPPEKSTNWVNKDHVDRAPIWCSVDLRDGNQALVVPMSLQEKLDFFKFLCSLGFKEIEVGFPAASETEYEFTRKLIEEDLIPDDVTIQVLTQSRQHIIEKTFEALKGAKKAIVHLYNSTSVAQREQVFKKSKEEIKDIAVFGAELINEYAAKAEGTDFTFEYSPESFTGTEMEYALDICNTVIDVWKPSPERKVIINLPATVSMSMPHVYASQIEYMSNNLHNRDNVIVSLHPHNDRGTGVADCELGLLAGGDRVEGTLFGNGERTGNVDIVTVALNMYSHGVDPELDFSDMPNIVKKYEEFTDMKVPPRQPYGGELVFAAFSGSHQDAIAKGMHYREDVEPDKWNVPYIPIDPHDISREYEADVIRINSQSGKGGVAYILETNYGYKIPNAMREEIGYMMKHVSDVNHKELSPSKICEIFEKEYVNRKDKYQLKDATFRRLPQSETLGDNGIEADIEVVIDGKTYKLEGRGNGRLDAITNAIRKGPYHEEYDFITYEEHALEGESNSRAAAYVAIADKQGNTYWGVGIHNDIIYASINALMSAINRAF
ncbi:MAG: 2-isopropylmalate synthase [Firmicutes bacterium]|nr:2-isopropylmalate synthase [Bacillota bacterium]MDD7285840.1 2-isopropylmalate synthase [Bacillota bacterium]